MTPATLHPDFTYHLLRNLRAHPEHREDIRVVRVTRIEAAARLKVSKSTLDRMIKRGEITTETEQHGQRHTVWVLMDDDIEDTAEVSTGNTNGHFPEVPEHIGDNIKAENLVLQAEVKGLRELVDLYRERLTDSDWRYQELMEQFKTMPKALPMAPEGTSPSETPVVALPVSSGPAQSRPEHQTDNFRGIRLKGPAPAADRREFLRIRPSRMRFKAPGILRPTQRPLPYGKSGFWPALASGRRDFPRVQKPILRFVT